MILSPFENMAENDGGALIHFNANITGSQVLKTLIAFIVQLPIS